MKLSYKDRHADRPSSRLLPQPKSGMCAASFFLPLGRLTTHDIAKCPGGSWGSQNLKMGVIFPGSLSSGLCAFPAPGGNSKSWFLLIQILNILQYLSIKAGPRIFPDKMLPSTHSKNLASKGPGIPGPCLGWPKVNPGRRKGLGLQTWNADVKND